MKNFTSVLFICIFLFACNSSDEKKQLINEKASLSASFKFSEFGLKVMTSFIDKNTGTMSVLYANNLSLNKAKRGDSLHAAGEVMALITWKQKADDYWFGARVPGQLQSIELVNTVNDENGGLSNSYKKYVGDRLVADPNVNERQQRTKYILDQRPSILP